MHTPLLKYTSTNPSSKGVNDSYSSVYYTQIVLFGKHLFVLPLNKRQHSRIQVYMVLV